MAKKAILNSENECSALILAKKYTISIMNYFHIMRAILNFDNSVFPEKETQTVCDILLDIIAYECECSKKKFIFKEEDECEYKFVQTKEDEEKLFEGDKEDFEKTSSEIIYYFLKDISYTNRFYTINPRKRNILIKYLSILKDNYLYNERERRLLESEKRKETLEREKNESDRLSKNKPFNVSSININDIFSRVKKSFVKNDINPDVLVLKNTDKMDSIVEDILDIRIILDSMRVLIDPKRVFPIGNSDTLEKGVKALASVIAEKCNEPLEYILYGER